MLSSLRAVPAVKTGGPWHTQRPLGGGAGRSSPTTSENGAEPRNQKPARSNALVSNKLSGRGEQKSSLREPSVYSTELERVRTGRPGEAGIILLR